MMGRFFGRVLIGFVMSLPIITLATGSLEDGLSLLALSIICTAGIGLAGWIPAWWILGAITMLIVRQFSRRLEGNPAGRSGTALNQSAPTLPADVAIIEYVSHATANGIAVKEIARRLQTNGWTAEEIRVAFQAANVPLPSRNS